VVDSPQQPVDLFVDLRGKAMHYVSTRADSAVHGLVADIAYDEGTVTIVCLDDDTTAMYTSHGGGIIGAGEHEHVVAVTRRVLELAALQQVSIPLVTDDRLPLPGNVQFSVLTRQGVRSDTADEVELDNKTHPLSPLFFAIQDVVTELGRVDPSL
jgi:hypothetical protein